MTLALKALAVVLALGLLSAVSGCGSGSGSKEAFKQGSRAVDDLRRIRKNPADLPQVGPGQLASERAAHSAEDLSVETGTPLEEVQLLYCELIGIYQQEGPIEDFVGWAMTKVQSPPARFEAAMAELGSAVHQAEEGEALDAFSTALCAY